MSTPQAPEPLQHSVIPEAEALLAGTLALMTGYSHAQAQCPMRPLIAAKLARNLSVLARHPDLSDPMRNVIRQMYRRWHETASAAPAQSTDRELWHPLSPTLQ
jgi:hypothetical protein